MDKWRCFRSYCVESRSHGTSSVGFRVCARLFVGSVEIFGGEVSGFNVGSFGAFVVFASGDIEGQGAIEAEADLVAADIADGDFVDLAGDFHEDALAFGSG